MPSGYRDADLALGLALEPITGRTIPELMEETISPPKNSGSCSRAAAEPAVFGVGRGDGLPAIAQDRDGGGYRNAADGLFRAIGALLAPEDPPAGWDYAPSSEKALKDPPPSWPWWSRVW